MYVGFWFWFCGDGWGWNWRRWLGVGWRGDGVVDLEVSEGMWSGTLLLIIPVLLVVVGWEWEWMLWWLWVCGVVWVGIVNC